MTLERRGDVPREAVGPLQDFVELFARWNARINLVSRAEPADIWARHVLDSAQLIPLAPADAARWLDLGSGGGFPGVVCAIISRALERPAQFTLVEADGRKIAFLREAARLLAPEVTVLHARIESVALPPHDVISARALAPLARLLDYAEPFIHPQTVLLFPKGRQASSELTAAQASWHIEAEPIQSGTDPDGTIFRISEARRRP